MVRCCIIFSSSWNQENGWGRAKEGLHRRSRDQEDSANYSRNKNYRTKTYYTKVNESTNSEDGRITLANKKHCFDIVSMSVWHKTPRYEKETKSNQCFLLAGTRELRILSRKTDEDVIAEICQQLQELYYFFMITFGANIVKVFLKATIFLFFFFELNVLNNKYNWVIFPSIKVSTS